MHACAHVYCFTCDGRDSQWLVLGAVASVAWAGVLPGGGGGAASREVQVSRHTNLQKVQGYVLCNTYSSMCLVINNFVESGMDYSSYNCMFSMDVFHLCHISGHVWSVAAIFGTRGRNSTCNIHELESVLSCFRSKSGRFTKLVQHKSKLTTTVEALST